MHIEEEKHDSSRILTPLEMDISRGVKIRDESWSHFVSAGCAAIGSTSSTNKTLAD
jgi:hypothetical protein